MHAPEDGQPRGFPVQPPLAAPARQRYGALLPHPSPAHWVGVHAGQPFVGAGAGPGGRGAGVGPGGLVRVLTISWHQGISVPPRTSFTHVLLGNRGCCVSAKLAHTLPQKPWSALKPQPWARAAVTFRAWQLDVKTAQNPPPQGLTALGVRVGAA